jgi:hypothetical protein
MKTKWGSLPVDHFLVSNNNETGAGKGDSPRAVNLKKYAENYDRIFRRKKPNKKKSPSEKK